MLKNLKLRLLVLLALSASVLIFQNCGGGMRTETTESSPNDATAARQDPPAEQNPPVDQNPPGLEQPPPPGNSQGQSPQENSLSIRYIENPVSYVRLRAVSENRVMLSRALESNTRFSISPQLPGGLVFDSNNGSISGIPQVTSSNQAYRVQVLQNDQVISFTSLMIEIQEPPPDAPLGLSYASTDLQLWEKIEFSLASPRLTQGRADTYTVSPMLPPGLVLNRSTGEIRGIPENVQPKTLYTISASNSSGTSSVNIFIAIGQSQLSYEIQNATFIATQSAGPLRATLLPAGLGGISYAVSPPLPSGLLFDSSTGAISGNPTAEAPSAEYLIEALKAGLRIARTRINIRVNPAPIPAPTNLAYPTTGAIYVRGRAIEPWVPRVTGVVSRYSVSPELPIGLSLHPQTGVISGTPVNTFDLSSFSIKAENASGFTLAAVQIQVFGRPLRFKWSVDSANRKLVLPTLSGLIYNFKVDWGDNVREQITSVPPEGVSHTYLRDGIFEVNIWGRFPGLSSFFVSNSHLSQNRCRVTEVLSIGETDLRSISPAFEDCKILEKFNGDGDISQVTSLEGVFRGASATEVDLSTWDTKKVTSLKELFYQFSGTKVLLDSWNTSQVTDMSNTFYFAKFNPDVSSWNTSNVENFSYMFYGTTTANPNVAKWNTSKAKYMTAMFGMAKAANPDVSLWDVSNVESFATAFYATKIANPNVGSWDTSKASRFAYMFSEAQSANPDVSRWNTSNGVYFEGMFSWTKVANPSVRSWNTSKATNLGSMFRAAEVANPDVSLWDTSNVLYFDNVFSDTKVANPNVANWNTSKATTFRSMFYQAEAANPDVSRWDTSNVSDFWFMFYGATRANPNVANWNTSKATTFAYMFSYTLAANPDVSRWDTSNVNDFSFMFLGAKAANPNVGNWNTSKAVSFWNMFAETKLANPNVANWNTSKVVNFTGMFASAEAAKPDVIRWDTSSGTDFGGMFAATKLANPNVSNWNMSKATRLTGMFGRAEAANPDVSRWDVSNAISFNSMFFATSVANPDVSQWNTAKARDFSSMFSAAKVAQPNISKWNVLSVDSESVAFLDFYSGALSSTVYTQFLVKTSADVKNNGGKPSGVKANFGSSKYDKSAQPAKDYLQSLGWKITDGGSN